MPFDVRPIAVKAAVICFFGLSFISSANGLSPLTSCKRAVIAAIFAYIVATYAVKAINAIVTNAIIKSQINQEKEVTGAGKN